MQKRYLFKWGRPFFTETFLLQFINHQLHPYFITVMQFGQAGPIQQNS